MDIPQKKSQLREAIRGRLRSFSEKERQAESRTLCRTLEKHLQGGSLTVAAYVPLRDEADITPLLLKLLEDGHALFLPRVEAGKMIFRQVRSLERLPVGAFNIPEPPPDAPLLDPLCLTHALIPGRAFDRKGNRLGRGNGGYDHWIAAERKAHPSTQFFGVCLECQLVQEVPVEAHDERVDAVVTARGMLNYRF